MTIDPGSVEKDPAELAVELTDGRVTAHRVRTVRRGPPDVTWIGRTEGARARTRWSPPSTDPSPPMSSRTARPSWCTPPARDSGVRTQVPDSDITPENEPELHLDAAGEAGTDTTSVTTMAVGPVVDVMIVVNSTIATRYGTGLRAVAQNAIDRMNKALIDSQVGMEVRLVHLAEVPDAQIAVSWYGNVANLTRSARVAQLRDQYGADLVQAWGSYPSVCGQGYQPRAGQFLAAYGFSVINAVNAACMLGVGPAHEMGHNLGGGHDRVADRAQGRAGDAYGFLDVQRDVMTIMAYSRRTCPGGSCTQSWLYSNPNVTFNGLPVGRAGSEDNARNLRVNGALVANYKPTRV